MKKTFTITASARSDMGKGASRRLRRADQVPGIVYGAGKTPTTITIAHHSLLHSLENEAFYSQILDLDIDGKKEPVILRDLQRHPYKPRILHIDLQRINTAEKITMRIPLHFTGSEVSPGVKLSSGLISHLMTDVEVICLPKNLPEFIEVDLSKIEINQTIHLSELKLPSGIELVALAHDEDKPVATAYVPRVAAEETEAPVATEVPVAGKDAAKDESAGESTDKKGKEKG